MIQGFGLKPFIDDPFVIKRRETVRIGRALASVDWIERESGGPMRPVGRRRGKRPGSLYYSQKMGTMVGYESRNELAGLHHCEVDCNVVAYREQPHSLLVSHGDFKIIYTPDREDFLVGGNRRIVEVKGDIGTMDEEYRSKLRLMMRIYEELGIEFILMESQELLQEPRYSAIEAIQAYKRTSFSVAHVHCVRSAIGAAGNTSLREAVSALDGFGDGRAFLFAMVVARIVAIDLEQGLSPIAKVSMVIS